MSTVRTLSAKAYDTLRPLHTPAVLVLVALSIANLFVDVPAIAFAPFLPFFLVMLIGNMSKARSFNHD